MLPDDLEILANTAIENLRIAYRQSARTHLEKNIIVALAAVTQLREELTAKGLVSPAGDPTEYCAAV